METASLTNSNAYTNYNSVLLYALVKYIGTQNNEIVYGYTTVNILTTKHDNNTNGYTPPYV